MSDTSLKRPVAQPEPPRPTPRHDPIDPDRPFPTTRGLLSAAEIEMLLRPDLSDMDVPSSPPETVARETPDLDAPDHTAEYEAAAELAARLSLALRADCQLEASLHLTNATRAVMADLTAGVADALCLFADGSGQISAALTLGQPLARAIAMEACGARGIDGGGDSPLSPLETSLLFRILEPLASALGDGLTLVRIEPRADAAKALLPPANALFARLDAQVCGVSGTAGLVLREHQTDADNPTATTLSGPFSAVGRLPTELTARIASLNVSVSRLSDLKPGSTLLLGVPSDQPVELLVGGRQGNVVAEGDIGRRGNKIALKLTRKAAWEI